MSRDINQQQAGFTLVELMIATIVFAVILLGATMSIIQISRMYYKGLIIARTQDVTRSIIDDISRGTQFNDQTVTSRPNIIGNFGNGSKQVQEKSFCIGNTRYTYAINTEVTNDQSINGTYNQSGTHLIRHALWKDTTDDQGICADPNSNDPKTMMPDLRQAQPSSQGRELLDQSMRLTLPAGKTFINYAMLSGGTNHIWNIDLIVAYGDDDVFAYDSSGNPNGCLGSNVGAQWCSLSELQTNVFQRINK